jgi:peptidyl-prolyl cis-trans isomerase D
MLTAIRDRVSGWIAYFIVLLISIPFALWGIDQYFGGGDPRVAAEVNGVEIPVEAFAYQFQQQRQYLQQVYGGNLTANVSDAAIEQAVIQGMVRAEVLQQEAQEAGYRVGDEALLYELSRIEAFQTDGQFDIQRYEQLLQAQQQTRAGFEQNLRRQLGLSYFEDGIWRSAFLPPSVKQDLLRLKNQRRDLEYFVIPADPASVKIGDKATSKYYEVHQDRFQTPEKVKLAYVELSEKALMNEIQADESALIEYYQSQVNRYIIPEQRKARHILLKLPEGAGQDAIRKARQRAKGLVARLRAGKDFAKLAEQYSEDALSASSGGDLGFIARGDLDPRVEDVLFTLKKGEISDPIRTDLGFQIVQLTEVKPARQKPFEDVRAEVERDYRRQEAQERFVEQAEQLLTLTYEQSGSLEPAAEALGLEIQRSGWLTRSQGAGIASNPKIRSAAFKEDVLQGRYNSDMVELGQGHVAVLRVIEHEPAQPQPLQEVRNDIKQILAVQAAREQAAKAGRQALAKLQSGKAINDVAERYQASIETPGFVERTEAIVPQPIVAKVFALNKPSPGGATVGGVELANGYAVIALRNVQAGGGDEATTSNSEPAVNYGLRERDAAYRALKAAAEINIMRENL